MTSYWHRFKQWFENNIDRWPDFLGWLMLGFGLIGFISEYFRWSFLYIPILSDLILRVWPELFGIGIAVIVIDNANELLREREEKKRLILQMGSPTNAFALESVRQLRARGWLKDGSLQGAYLLGANLEKANLGEANLKGARLMDANMQGAYLIKANLEQAWLEDAKLVEANLTKANLESAILDDATLKGADLWMANLQGAKLRRSNLEGANLREAHLSNAILERANLTGANLIEAHLIFTKMGQAKLDRAILEGAEILSVDFKDSSITTEQLASAIILDGKPMLDGIPRGIGTIMPNGTVINPKNFEVNQEEQEIQA